MLLFQQRSDSPSLPCGSDTPPSDPRGAPPHRLQPRSTLKHLEQLGERLGKAFIERARTPDTAPPRQRRRPSFRQRTPQPDPPPAVAAARPAVLAEPVPASAPAVVHLDAPGIPANDTFERLELAYGCSPFGALDSDDIDYLKENRPGVAAMTAGENEQLSNDELAVYDAFDLAWREWIRLPAKTKADRQRKEIAYQKFRAARRRWARLLAALRTPLFKPPLPTNTTGARP